MEDETRFGWIWELFETEPELFEQVYQLLNAGIRRAVNGSLKVTESPSKTILNEKRMLVVEPKLDSNSKDSQKMRELGRPSRTIASLINGRIPESELDQVYLDEILAGLWGKLNP